MKVEAPIVKVKLELPILPTELIEEVVVVIDCLIPEVELLVAIVKEDGKTEKINKIHRLIKVKDKKFTCKVCCIAFPSYRSLGGHASKKHPGQSKKYTKRVQVRLRRDNQRECLKLA